MSNSLQLHGLYSPWNSPGQKNIGVGSHSLFQGIFPTQALATTNMLSASMNLPVWIFHVDGVILYLSFCV